VGAAADADPDIPGDTPPLPADFEPADVPSETGLPTVVDTPGGIFSGPLVGAATDPQRYLVFDALGMQRNNALKDGPLIVENATPQFTALQKNMLQSTVAPGARLLYGDYGSDGIGWETGYLGLWNMYSRARMESPNALLQAPGGLGFASTAMRNGTQGDFTGITSLQSADVNVVFHQFDGGWNPRSPRPSQRDAPPPRRRRRPGRRPQPSVEGWLRRGIDGAPCGWSRALKRSGAGASPSRDAAGLPAKPPPTPQRISRCFPGESAIPRNSWLPGRVT
jgi:hypothetical protein